MNRIDRRCRAALACCGFLLVCAAAAAAEFKLYPGASTDAWSNEAQKAARSALPPGTESDVYVTNDAYEKVYAFYKAGAREVMLSPGPALPNGTQIKWSFFILDRADTMAKSKLWLKVQRPTVADMEMKNVKDVTSIQVVRKK